MPLYSDLSLFGAPSSSYYSPGPYSNHSSLLSSTYRSPVYIKTLPRTFPRSFAPHLATISESQIISPIRRKFSPKLLLDHHGSAKFVAPKPIKINTADIDVSVNKYRKYDRKTGVTPEKSPSPSRPEVREDEEEQMAKPIRRDRALVRLHTVHKKDSPRRNLQNGDAPKSWRHNFYPSEPKQEKKLPRRTPGELLMDKFLIRTKEEEERFRLEGKKLPRKASVKPKSSHFHEICRQISSENISEDLNPGQPAETARRQSKSNEDIMRDIRRNSTEILKENVLMLEEMLKDEHLIKEEDENNNTSRGSVKRKKKATKKKSGDLLTLPEGDVPAPLHRRATQKKIKRTSTDASIPEDEEAYQMAIRDTTSQTVVEAIKAKPKITATVKVESSPASPVLKAFVDEVEIVESPKVRRPGKFKFNVTIEGIEKKRYDEGQVDLPESTLKVLDSAIAMKREKSRSPAPGEGGSVVSQKTQVSVDGGATQFSGATDGKNIAADASKCGTAKAPVGAATKVPGSTEASTRTRPEATKFSATKSSIDDKSGPPSPPNVAAATKAETKTKFTSSTDSATKVDSKSGPPSLPGVAAATKVDAKSNLPSLPDSATKVDSKSGPPSPPGIAAATKIDTKSILPSSPDIAATTKVDSKIGSPSQPSKVSTKTLVDGTTPPSPPDATAGTKSKTPQVQPVDSKSGPSTPSKVGPSEPTTPPSVRGANATTNLDTTKTPEVPTTPGASKVGTTKTPEVPTTSSASKVATPKTPVDDKSGPSSPPSVSKVSTVKSPVDDKNKVTAPTNLREATDLTKTQVLPTDSKDKPIISPGAQKSPETNGALKLDSAKAPILDKKSGLTTPETPKTPVLSLSAADTEKSNLTKQALPKLSDRGDKSSPKQAAKSKSGAQRKDSKVAPRLAPKEENASGEDFWRNINTRESAYWDKRKKTHQERRYATYIAEERDDEEAEIPDISDGKSSVAKILKAQELCDRRTGSPKLGRREQGTENAITPSAGKDKDIGPLSPKLEPVKPTGNESVLAVSSPNSATLCPKPEYPKGQAAIASPLTAKDIGVSKAESPESPKETGLGTPKVKDIGIETVESQKSKGLGDKLSGNVTKGLESPKDKGLGGIFQSGAPKAADLPKDKGLGDKIQSGVPKPAEDPKNKGLADKFESGVPKAAEDMKNTGLDDKIHSDVQKAVEDPKSKSSADKFQGDVPKTPDSPKNRLWGAKTDSLDPPKEKGLGDAKTGVQDASKVASPTPKDTSELSKAGRDDKAQIKTGIQDTPKVSSPTLKDKKLPQEPTLSKAGVEVGKVNDESNKVPVKIGAVKDLDLEATKKTGAGQGTKAQKKVLPETKADGKEGKDEVKKNAAIGSKVEETVAKDEIEPKKGKAVVKSMDSTPPSSPKTKAAPKLKDVDGLDAKLGSPQLAKKLPALSKPKRQKINEGKPADALQSVVTDLQQQPLKAEVTEEEDAAANKKIISKRSLINKSLKDDPDLREFVVPEEPPNSPAPQQKQPENTSTFVPLQSNRLSQWMNPFKKPEQYEQCPVQIYAKPKTIRGRHYPKPYGPEPKKEEESESEEEDDEEEEEEEEGESSEGESESESSEEEDSVDYEALNDVWGYGKVGASTSSDDSGFDSSSLDNRKNKGCSERDSPTSNPAHNPAFALDPNEIAEEFSQSSTFAGFQKSGRITPPATTIPRFRKYNVDDFNFLKVLGKGSFGKVLLAELKDTEYYYAIKCLKKDVVLEDDDVECTLIERKVLALGTKHPYLCHLLCTFQTESHLFFVMEYLNGGDLMFHIQLSGRFSEPRARFYAAEIVSGLKFLHSKGIVYRDLKLDNILLDFDGHVRIADFGMCKLQIFLDRTADTFCGTPDYMAPEIIKGQHYNQNVDWWSFGVLLYEMLIGQSPFSGCDEDELFWSICNERPVLPRFLSKEASSILTLFLEKDASKRLGNKFCQAGDIQDQPFFHPVAWDLLNLRQLEPPFKPNLQHPLDTQYFDRTFTLEKAKITPIDKNILQSMDQTQFQGFSYTNPNATDR